MGRKHIPHGVLRKVYAELGIILLDGAQLAAFLSAYASGEIALPQPDADYTDEQEETEDEA